MMISEKIYLKPTSVEEAIQLAHEHENSFRFLAGGTDVIVNKFQDNDDPECLIDITGIDELKELSVYERESSEKIGEWYVVHPAFRGWSETNYITLKIGSLITLDGLKEHKIIAENFPMLLEAAHQAASPLLRKTATIGGNILCENRCSFYNQSEWWRTAVGYCLKCDGDVCIATGGKKACFSKFVSDTAPVLISYDAMIEVSSPPAPLQGRWEEYQAPGPLSRGEGEGIQTSLIPLESIYTGDGIQPRNLSKTGLIKNIQLPLNRNFKSVFKKLRPREAVDFTSLTTVVTVDGKGKLKIVIGGVDPKPVVVEGLWTNEKKGEFIRSAVKKCRVVDNDFYSRTYRKEMITVFLEQSFEELDKMINNNSH